MMMILSYEAASCCWWPWEAAEGEDNIICGAAAARREEEEEGDRMLTTEQTDNVWISGGQIGEWRGREWILLFTYYQTWSRLVVNDEREFSCVLMLTEGGEKKGRTTDHLAPPATEAPLKAPASPSIHPFFIMYDFWFVCVLLLVIDDARRIVLISLWGDNFHTDPESTYTYTPPTKSDPYLLLCRRE